MRIAIATENGMVTQHFGYCEKFSIFDVENNQIIRFDEIPNPGHRPGFLPVYLYENGVEVIISGGMGSGAVTIFNEKGIEVITGAQGRVEDCVELYLNNQLKSTGSICHEHAHHDECDQ